MMEDVLEALGPAIGAYMHACETRRAAVAAGLPAGPFDEAVEAAAVAVTALTPDVTSGDEPGAF